MVYELVGFNTDSRYRDDVRWREYTTSEKKAEQFGQIRKVQFSDSGHGIVFQAIPLDRGQRRKPERRALMSHVPGELARIKRESKWPDEVRDLVARARELTSRAGPPSDDVLTNHPKTIEGNLYDRLFAAVQALEPQA